MQVSFLKDLVTLRNPTSPFCFLSYLHDRDWLVDFINYGSFLPTRIEFHDYLEWAAARFDGQVDYGVEVIEMWPVRGSGGSVDHVEEISRLASGEMIRPHTRNVVLATGLTPNLPCGVKPGERVWHSQDLLTRAPEIVGSELKRLAVVGAGRAPRRR